MSRTSITALSVVAYAFGWGWAMLAAYLAPLVGTILYIVFSGQRGYEDASQPAALTTYVRGASCRP